MTAPEIGDEKRAGIAGGAEIGAEIGARSGDDGGAPREREASDWFARMHGPDAAASREDFDRWYGLAGNAAAYDRLGRIWDATKFVANTPTGRGRDLTKARAGRVSSGRLAAVAASLAALVVLTLWGLQQPSLHHALPDSAMPSADAGAAPSADALAAGAGKPIIITAALHEPPRVRRLTDGSRILLDRGARIAIDYTGPTRHLQLLAGQARFDVAHLPGRPFVVDAGGGRVTAHGTRFDVALDRTAVRVALLRGMVDVRGTAPSGQKALRQLRPGQAIALDRGTLGALQPLRPADARWASDMIEFDATPIAEAVAQFNRTSAAHLELAFDRAPRCRISGVFRRGDPAAFAHQVAETFALRLTDGSSGDLVLSSRDGMTC